MAYADIDKKRAHDREAMRKWRKKNTEKNKKYNREYMRSRRTAGLCPYYKFYLKDPKHKKNRLAYSRKYWNGNREKLNELSKSYTKNLTDNYIVRKLRQDGFSLKAIRENPNLLELKKQILKIKRLANDTN